MAPAAWAGWWRAGGCCATLKVLQVYGPALKALIHEDFGDGIMSAITFNLALERRETDAGPRVRITLDGKFLPYQWEG